MQNTDMLFIRACKSNNANRRIKRLYSSIYYDEYNDTHMADILLRIVAANQLVRIDKLVHEYLNPKEVWKFGASIDEDYYTRVVKAMISIIRLTEVSRLVGFIAPIKFRR